MTAGKLNLSSGVDIDIMNQGIDQPLPKFSFFTSIYRRHTNFSMDSRQLTIEGTGTNALKFGGNTFSLTFNRGHGDLVGDIYFEIKLPAPTDCFTVMPASYANWTNSIGYAIIESVKLKIGGGTIIDDQSGLWLDIQNELTDPNRKEWSMVGKVDDQTKLKYFQTQQTTYIVPLRLSLCKTPGLALPIYLSGTSSTTVKIEVKFKSLANLLLHDGGTVDTSVNLVGFKAIAKYYSLDQDEINRIRNNRATANKVTQLIETVQPIQSDTNKNNIDLLGIKGSIKEIIWVVQHDTRTTTNNPIIRDKIPIGTPTGNDHFNYSGTSLTNNALDPFTSVTLEVGQTYESESRDPTHFRQYLPYKHHSNVPNNYVYTLPLCLNPEDYQPSGALHLRNVNIQKMRLILTDLHSGCSVKLFAVAYQSLIITTNNIKIKDDNFAKEKNAPGELSKQSIRAQSKTTYREQPSTSRIGPGVGRAQAVVSSGDMTLINNQIASQEMIINELKSKLEKYYIKTQSLSSQLEEIKRDREIGMVQRGRRQVRRVRTLPNQGEKSDLLK